jgi:hypothetical protein
MTKEELNRLNRANTIENEIKYYDDMLHSIRCHYISLCTAKLPKNSDWKVLNVFCMTSEKTKTEEIIRLAVIDAITQVIKNLQKELDDL